MKPLRIQFAGPSGVGKTTLAKWLEEAYQIPFVSGSVSDLLPKTKEEPHKDMLSHDKKELYTQDYQILNLRNKLYSEKESYVSDRSYLDSAAYFMYKQSDTIPQCELEHFFELCKKCLVEQTDLLIILGFTPYMVKNWVMEDNNKRILNKYFQAQISYIMKYLLNEWGMTFFDPIPCIHKGIGRKDIYLTEGQYYTCRLTTLYGSTSVIWIDEPGLDTRKEIIDNYLKRTLKV